MAVGLKCEPLTTEDLCMTRCWSASLRKIQRSLTSTAPHRCEPPKTNTFGFQDLGWYHHTSCSVIKSLAFFSYFLGSNKGYTYGAHWRVTPMTCWVTPMQCSPEEGLEESLIAARRCWVWSSDQIGNHFSPQDPLDKNENDGFLHGFPWIPIWIPMDSYGFLCFPMDFHGFPWIPMASEYCSANWSTVCEARSPNHHSKLRRVAITHRCSSCGDCSSSILATATMVTRHGVVIYNHYRQTIEIIRTIQLLYIGFRRI